MALDACAWLFPGFASFAMFPVATVVYEVPSGAVSGQDSVIDPPAGIVTGNSRRAASAPPTCSTAVTVPPFAAPLPMFRTTIVMVSGSFGLGGFGENEMSGGMIWRSGRRITVIIAMLVTAGDAS